MTTRYRFVVDYASHVGTWAAGDVVEFDDPELAAWLNRDVDGCLVSADEPTVTTEPEPEPERAVAEPPHDRQIKNARNRKRSAEDGG